MTEHDWLVKAAMHGYEHPFDAPPVRALVNIEKLGLVERNHCSPSECPEWRITEKGIRWLRG